MTEQKLDSSALSSSIAPMAVTSSTTVSQGARSASPSSATSNGARCCDSGRPLFIDPISGQTVCSCQYDLINYQRLAGMAAGGSGMPLSMYSTPYSAETMAAYFPALGGDQHFYPNPAAAGMDMKDSLAGGSWPYPSVYQSYDAALAGYHFNGYPMDLNGRRKNATRESTGTLKAWLSEHKKNPYPTKGEKIMLAIITKMTMTQISTWFANARRRLKKDNKVTWEPRNRVEDDEDINLDDDDDHKSNDDKDMLDSKDSVSGSSEDGDHRPSRLDMLDHQTESHSPDRSGPPHQMFQGKEAFHPGMYLHHLRSPPMGSPITKMTTTPSSSNAINKPRIWSLADMASKESKDDAPASIGDQYNSAAGKIMSPLAGRGFHPMHHPYMRPELYRGFYGPSAAHMAEASPDALLESYQRTFGIPSGAQIGTLMSKPPQFGPLSLTTSAPAISHPQPPSLTRASPAISSASSSPEHHASSSDKPVNR